VLKTLLDAQGEYVEPGMDHEIQLYITVTPVTVPVAPAAAPPAAPAPPTAAGDKTDDYIDTCS
jgi:hypothetical protein